MESFDNNAEKTLNLFLEIASMKIENEASGPSVYASQLYKWLELIDACNVMVGGMPLSQDKQHQTVSKALGGDSKKAKALLESIQKNTLACIDSFKSNETITLVYPVLPSIKYDKDGTRFFHYGVSATGSPNTQEVNWVIFLNLVGHMLLEPDRFRVCPKCGKHFYQYQRKSQKYCSRSCSDMGRSGKSYLDA